MEVESTKDENTYLDAWFHGGQARAPRNEVIVAIGNKLARIAWAVWFSGEVYQHLPVTTA
jgi:hypothetical protein